jgi:CheY-like chemotaxis protein
MTSMPKKALVVDNNYFFVEFLSELLEKRGHSVTKAYNGKEGLSKLKNGPVDIIFADLIMPKVDVRQFIQFIRMKYQENQFPIVALSGTVIEQMSELDEIGADYYIPKGPIDKLTIQLNEFMAEFENQPFVPSTK